MNNWVCSICGSDTSNVDYDYLVNYDHISCHLGVWGGKDVPSQLPFHASSLYSRNVVNLLTLLTKPAAEGSALSLNLDFEDEIINGSAVTHAGAKRNGGAK